MLTRPSLAFALTMLAGLSLAHTQELPNRPIKMIVPFTPGSPVDVVARLLAQRLPDQLKQTVVIDNRPGAGTTIGMKAATLAEPDGSTLLFQSSSFVVARAMYKNLDFDPAKSFAPVANVAWGSWVTVVPPSLPASTLRKN
jgi:tripartite-type tricarboxylate transporter receptor subunit TctC